MFDVAELSFHSGFVVIREVSDEILGEEGSEEASMCRPPRPTEDESMQVEDIHGANGKDSKDESQVAFKNEDGSFNLTAGDGIGDAAADEVKETLSATQAGAGEKANEGAKTGAGANQNAGAEAIAGKRAIADIRKAFEGEKVNSERGAALPLGENSDESLGTLGPVDPLMEVFVCKECGKEFENHEKLRGHMYYHKSRNAFKCDWPDCEKTFHGKFQLSAHRRVHTGEKPFSCLEQDCNKAFKNVGDLNRHHKLCHSEKKVVERKLVRCPIPDCTKEFTQKSALIRHQRIHSGEKPFECPHPGCSRRFTLKQTLKRHMMTHSGEKPFKCQMQGCQMAFALKANLHRHEKNHKIELEHKVVVEEEEGPVAEAEIIIPDK